MANTLAYYDTATITAVKSFIVQAPDVKILAVLKTYLDVDENFVLIDNYSVFCSISMSQIFHG